MEYIMIVVIGDSITDIYIYGSVERISPESPIPIFKTTRQEKRAGGSGNVVSNLVALGESVLHYHDPNNSIKTRYVCDNHILFRADTESYKINSQTEFDLRDSNYVILSDYNKGFLHNSRKIIEYCNRMGKKVIVDPKKSLENYTGAHIVKLNKKEFLEYGYGNTPFQARKLFKIDTIIITSAAAGIQISSDELEITIPNNEIHQVSDVTGAGDVFIAALTHFLDKGNDLITASTKSMRLASLSVTKFGTYVLTKEDIAKTKLVFTNGCFDIIHRGHIEYLKKSKSMGYKLVVGLNSDTSIRRLKGDSRPINNQEDRKTVLESLDCVDEVIIFNEDTPYELIKKLKPDLITKGGDYKSIEEVVGHDLAEVELIPYLEGYSTTNIVEKIDG